MTWWPFQLVGGTDTTAI